MSPKNVLQLYFRYSQCIDIFGRSEFVLFFKKTQVQKFQAICMILRGLFVGYVANATLTSSSVDLQKRLARNHTMLQAKHQGRGIASPFWLAVPSTFSRRSRLYAMFLRTSNDRRLRKNATLPVGRSALRTHIFALNVVKNLNQHGCRRFSCWLFIWLLNVAGDTSPIKNSYRRAQSGR